MRLIDADALIKRAEELENDPWNRKTAPHNWAQAYVTVQEELDNAPTIDAVPVLRCKDCKHYKDGRCFFTMRRHGLHDDWFCADGERRESDEK